MQSLEEMLASRKPQEPPQVHALKMFAQEKYAVAVQVVVNKNFYLVKVPSAALAHRFRMDTQEITESCSLNKRLVIHIGY
jgi:hypothetical protein